MKNKIKAVIFDYGGVLCYKQDDNCIKKMLNILKINKDDFLYQYKIHRTDYDKGLINGSKYWKNILKTINLTLNEEIINKLIQIDLKSWDNINNKMIKFIKKIKSKFEKIAILSNMHFDFLQLLENKYKWLNLFNEKIFSCNLKLVKPDLSIYEYCLKKLNYDSSDCLFIDDTEDNINAAKNLGIKTILYNTFDDFKKELFENYIY